MIYSSTRSRLALEHIDRFYYVERQGLALAIALAGYCHQHRGDLDAWRLAITLGLAAVPMALVMLQNDLGTMLVMCVIVAAVVLVAGIRPLHIATVFLVVATLVGTLAVTGRFSGYRLDRLTSFLHQGPVSTQTASPAEYNLTESKSAIQHGGFTGTGLYKGTLTK